MSFGQKKSAKEDLILFAKTAAIQDLINEELWSTINPNDTTVLTNEEKIKRNFAIEINKNALNKVIKNYEQLIKEYPKSNLLFRALNNKGFAELELNDNKKAKETFLEILKSKANDKEKGGIGSGIMGEPYANYKNRACKMLAELEIKNGNYQEALNYLNETKNFPYQHFCGNEYAADDIYMADSYSKCYLGLNQYEKAYDQLIPNIIENGLASNFVLVNTAINALLKNYKKEDLKIQFENSFKNVTVEKITANKSEYTAYNINFLNRKIKLDIWQLYEGMNEAEKQKEYNRILSESEFYKLLTK